MTTTYYQVGVVSVENGSTVVLGTETNWLSSASLLKPMAGCPFTIDRANYYMIESVDSDTQLTLTTPYLQASRPKTSYAVLLNREVEPGDKEPDILLLIAQANQYAQDAEASAVESQSQASNSLSSAIDASSHKLAAEAAASASEQYSLNAAQHSADASAVVPIVSAKVVEAETHSTAAAAQNMLAQQALEAARDEVVAAKNIEQTVAQSLSRTLTAESDVAHQVTLAKSHADNAFGSFYAVQQEADRAEESAIASQASATSSELSSVTAQAQATKAQQEAGVATTAKNLAQQSEQRTLVAKLDTDKIRQATDDIRVATDSIRQDTDDIRVATDEIRTAVNYTASQVDLVIVQHTTALIETQKSVLKLSPME